MTSEYVKKTIKELEPWYQRFKIDDMWTTSRKSSTQGLWNQVEAILPDDMTGMKAIDLGCSAAIYSCRTANKGASVIGIDNGDLSKKQSESNK